MNRPDLIDLVAGDLPGHRCRRQADGSAIMVPVTGGPVLEVYERVERRFLGRTRVARFVAAFPASGRDEGRLQVRHTGRMRRTGIIVTGDPALSTLGAALEADPIFAAAAMTLDFTSYEVAFGAAGCRASIELMGATLVAIALPPIRSYVRLHPDQREAMIGGLEALGRVLSVSPAHRRY